MLIGPRGQNLIFIISQPRAGSTMLQRMMGSHPRIHTLSEPWIMLHSLYALRREGYEAEYDAPRSWRAVDEFLDSLPGRREEYVEGLRRMHAYLYDRALVGSGKSHFLDKTPRYYLVVRELIQLFPDAQYVFLLRNPLSILASLVTEREHRAVLHLSDCRHDLLSAPAHVLQGIRSLADRCATVRYEDLVQQPQETMRGICEKLALDYEPEIVEYGGGGAQEKKWTFGDQGTVYEERQPVTDRIDRWKGVLSQSACRKKWAEAYLNALGRETVEAMGYPFDELKGAVRALHAPKDSVAITWDMALKGVRSCSLRERFRLLCLVHAPRFIARHAAGLKCSIRTRGLWGTSRLAWRRSRDWLLKRRN